MKKKINSIGIVQESRPDETRAPIAPSQVSLIIEKYPDINIVVQPCDKRTFKNNEYLEYGAKISKDLNSCDLLFGVKEVDVNRLIPNKDYVFFSHTYKLNKETLSNAQGTPGMDKKELLKSILNKKIKLIDYENIRAANGTRYLGFGRFAGIVGCYNTLNLFLSQNNFQPLARAFKLNNYERIKNNLSEIRFPNFKLLVTGDGRVNNGVQEVLKYTNIKQISNEEFLKSNFEYPVYSNLETKDYVVHKNNKPFELRHFIEFPKEYESQTYEYLKVSDIFISAHYWDPSSPKIFTREQIKQFSKLKIIGDVTCDVDGSIPTTIKSTTIEEPSFFLNTETFSKTEKSSGNLAIMAVDNLPSELPRDSSTEFGNGIVNEVIPYILGKDDGRILNSTITAEGRFLEKYNYLNEYINS
jgi:alanine dehydrogenase